MANVAKDLAQLISQSKSNKTGPYDTQATVKRVEGNTVWVSIPGGVDETPIDKTVNCTAGDKVQVRVSGGRAWITGNASAPPTDDKTANEAKTKAVVAEAAAIDAKETAAAVESVAINANTTAANAQHIAEGVNEHFWYDNTGAHITKVTQEDWNDSQSAGYHSGGNTLITSEGVAIRDGMRELGTFGANGQTFNNEYSHPILEVGRLPSAQYNSKANWTEYDGSSPWEWEIPWDFAAINHVRYFDANNDEITMAPTYTTEDRKLKYNAAACAELQSNGVKYIKINYNAVGQFPYYTIGSDGVGARGFYSYREGENVVASGITSHAEGDGSTASGANSHAEGSKTIAAGQDAHAEGSETQAPGSCSHAEGFLTIADGFASHASGVGTVADAHSQFVIGSYNELPVDTADVFIIGQGATENTRKNIFTVNLLGEVTAAGSITAEGHDSPIGYRPARATGSYSLASGTSWVTVPTANLTRITLSEGVWIMHAQVSFASNSTGWRGLRIYDVTTSESIGRSSVTQPACNGATTNMNTMGILSLTESNTFTLQVVQNSGAARNVDLQFHAVRIA